ncbi:branched-chain amino acid ABC transporter permease [Conexibacter sp. W3-3-2]|uniref:Branched-chain amino acid ABC transporter permease n=1 Tax=Paraconexibacter algicola TaxID=2133960 RepID=A0A2T4UEM3_9ACTN|nr:MULTISPECIES: branched-chain amino acid ABC transporter permease [Solirubrobacterales]MTD42852.1 branched-chain amino acid ABC transporter permease [Conexibacter sp. W3-3-2]PTL56228.1 branched-chain amino acid ABC transporter permease [Paraconexibacter algicola]
MSWMDVLSGAIEQALGPQAIVFCLAAIGLNIHFGYTGLLNFGQAAFMMVGGYAMASLVQTWGWNLWVSIVVGLLLSIVLALALGVPTLRLRADYLAIATIAAAEAIRQTLGASSLNDQFGGQDGRFGFADSMKDINPISSNVDIFGFLEFRNYDFFIMLVGWSLVAVLCVLVFLLMRSPWGRVLKSIREDEDAVRSLGKNVFGFKMQALVIGGMIGALAGMMSGLATDNVAPSDFATDTTFFTYTVLLIGGAARVLGPVAGALIFWFFLNGLDLFFDKATGPDGFIPEAIMSPDQASLMRLIVMGLVLMLLMIFRPQGIFGDRKELAIDGR